MKLLQEMEDATTNRKFIKSQVEKRRRERMNCSLERLRTMLLQEPQQKGGTPLRVEKAEILEHTVLFLQNTAKGNTTRAEGGGGDQKHSFQDGVSTCLQRAARFLGPEGQGLWLGAALDASFAARFSRSDSSDSAGDQQRTEAHSSSSSLNHTKSILRMLRQKSKHRLHTRAFGVKSFAHPYQVPVQHGLPRVPQQAESRSQFESLKPQVEKRRRERMNRSLESLKTLLLQRQEATQRRVEKAEILEQTVLFLQNTGGKTRAEGGGGGQKHSFQDGFSTCLQKAAQFLGPEGKGLWLGAALDASFAARFSRSDSSDSAGVQRRNEAHSSSRSLLTQSSRSFLRLLMQRSGYRLCTPALPGATCVQTRGESHRSPTSLQQPHTVTSRAGKQSASQSQPASQSLWRPWP
ncbi:hypothetical protein L3Q82_013523 [Scortum barcoo]|uniref:Uncharacterized protein n=1 Tax=Scortum barcoo TaxID=214431 RepID=A0ACB8W0L2_9TELE|nr:hypothetical protein L3Q82_013523 [Scortum barcoo]